MDNIYNFFSGNPWLNIMFLVLSIIGIYLTFVFYYKSLKNKVPLFSSNNIRLIDENISTIKNINIQYNGKTLKNLSLAKICFWNSGKEAIRLDDIAKSDPLKITTRNKEIFIYDFEISHQNIVNNINISKIDEHTLELTFEFLDFNDGVTINIYHSGKHKNDLQISGTLIGSKKISKGINEERLISKLNKIFIPADYLSNHDNKFFRILAVFVGLPALIIAFPFVFIFGPIDIISDRISKSRIPKEFYIEN